jgi:hypothetical protein
MHVLEQPLVLDLVLQYAGPDQWLFLGAVSKAWAALYTSVPHTRPARRQRALPSSVVHANTTSFVEAASSLARALYACDCDATLKTDKLLVLSEGAASCGCSHVLIWARAIDSFKWLEWHQQLCMAAAAGNQLATLQELRTRNPEPQWDVVKVAAKAAECADLAMLQWVVGQQQEWTVLSVVALGEGAAAAADSIEKITWLCQRLPDKGFALRWSFAVATCKRGAVETLQWLVSSNFWFNNATYAAAASAANQLAALRYLVEDVGCPWDATAVRKAAVKLDSAEMLKWASSADVAVWTTAQLSELLANACQKNKLRAAAWLKAAGAEWPTRFFYTDPYFRSTVWPLRAMRWARANGCPWGAWDHTMCASICSSSLYRELQERQATQEAMLWAHAAGCPCGSRWHRFVGALVRKSSSSSKDSSSSSSHGDAHGEVDTRSRWKAVLFKLFTGIGCLDLVATLIIVVAVVAAVVLAVQEQLNKEQERLHKEQEDLRAELQKELSEKSYLEKLLMIYTDKHIGSGIYRRVLDYSMQRKQLVQSYLQRRNLWDVVLSPTDTCLNHKVHV